MNCERVLKVFKIWSLFALGCVVRVIFNLWGEKKSIKFVTYKEGPDVPSSNSTS